MSLLPFPFAESTSSCSSDSLALVHPNLEAFLLSVPAQHLLGLMIDLGLLQVSATFAASLVTSPAIGAYLGRVYGDSLVVVLATAIALLDICFILVAVPESLPEKMRPASWGAPISWEQADPFAVSICFFIHFDKKMNV